MKSAEKIRPLTASDWRRLTAHVVRYICLYHNANLLHTRSCPNARTTPTKPTTAYFTEADPVSTNAAHWAAESQTVDSSGGGASAKSVA